MPISKLISLIALMLVVVVVLGLLSLNADYDAIAVSADEQRLSCQTLGQLRAEPPSAVAAQLIPDGEQILILPDAGDVLVREGKGIGEFEGCYEFADGEVYTWRDGHRQRIWLFAVAADEEPRVSIIR
jgi:hypothetical protein